MKRIWIKLFIELLDDPKMGRLPDWLWRRAVELFLLAGENGNDGLLQPVMDMAWRLRTSPEKLTESLQALSQVGVVHETPQGWVVTHFVERQAALTGAERVANYREKRSNEKVTKDVTKSYKESNEVEVSDSTSSSTSDSSLERGGAGEKTKNLSIPETPRQAMANPEIQLYQKVSGCFPGQDQYQVIVETIDLLRSKHGEMLEDFLSPYWLAWSTRKTKDGAPYSKKSLVWLCEWALQGDIPKANGHEPKQSQNWSPVPGVEETRRMLEDQSWRGEKRTGKASVAELTGKMVKS